MLSKGRFRFVAGIADNVDPRIRANETFASELVKLDPPLEVRVGYVMFGKRFYEDNKTLVECFWDESARLSKTDWYQKIVDEYHQN
jgi:hypothetical protein